RNLTMTFSYSIIGSWGVVLGVDKRSPALTMMCNKHISHEITLGQIGLIMPDSKPHVSSTMNEVAKVAGVSVATVSRVINGSGGVSEKLERRVRRAMKKLN